jgi:hypothetical protein
LQVSDRPGNFPKVLNFREVKEKANEEGSRKAYRFLLMVTVGANKKSLPEEAFKNF